MMSGLPRNRVIATKNLNRAKWQEKKNIKKEIIALNSLYDKYNIGPLTFRSVMFITPSGKITKVNHIDIKGNLHNGILFVSYSDTNILDNIYDLYTIALEKRKKDFVKREEEVKKMSIEMERLRKTDNMEEIPQGENSVDVQKEIPIDEPKGIPIDEPKEISIDEQKEISNNQIPIKRRANKITGNKYFRGFMQEIKSRYRLDFQDQYKFAEFKVESTDMIIDDVDIYKVKSNLFLIIGDFQMKSSVVRQLDPSFDAETATETHQKFMNSIKTDEIPPLKTEGLIPQGEILPLKTEGLIPQGEIPDLIPLDKS